MKIGKIRDLRFGEKKTGIIHTQRIKDLFFHQRPQIHTAHPHQHHSEDIDSQSITPCGSWVERQGEFLQS